MLISLSTACLFPRSLSTVFALAREAGFDGLELVIDPTVARHGSKYVSQLVGDFQLPVLSVHPPLFPLPGWREARERCLGTVELGRVLGCRVIVLHAPYTRSERGYEGVLRSIKRGQGVDSDGGIALENGRWLSAGTSDEDGGQAAIAHFHYIKDLAREQGWGLTLDTTHAGCAGVDILEAYELFKGRLVNIHLSDLRSLSWPRFLRRIPLIYDNLVQHHLPGKGALPLEALLRRLRFDSYQGLLTVEASPLAFQVWSLGQVRKSLQRVLQLCRGPK